MADLIPEGEDEEIAPGRRVQLRRLPLIEFPPELVGAKAEVVDVDHGASRPYTLELIDEAPPYRNRQINVKRHSFTTDA